MEDGTPGCRRPCEPPAVGERLYRASPAVQQGAVKDQGPGSRSRLVGAQQLNRGALRLELPQTLLQTGDS